MSVWNLLAACAAALATAAAAAQAAPIPPAGAAEIRRGGAAAYECYLRFSGLRQAADFAGCVQATHAGDQRAAGEGDAAFDAGLYFRAAQFIRIKVEVLQGDPPSDAPDLTPVLRALAAQSDQAQRKLHLTDSQMLELLAGQ